MPRAPAEDGAVAAVPPLSEVGRLLDENRRLERRFLAGTGRGQSCNATPGGPPARGGAPNFTSPPPRPSRSPTPAAERLIAAGHQPELFHPGVWVKNFALHGLARRHGLTPINLVVDNDTVKSTALRLPVPATVRSENPHAVQLPFDRWSGEVPWEERPVADEGLFAGFGEQAADRLRGWASSRCCGISGRWSAGNPNWTPLLGEPLRRGLQRRY